MATSDLHSIAFPTLEAAQIDELVHRAQAPFKSYRSGETLFICGARDCKFLIVKSGEVEILDYSGDEPKTIVIHHANDFTGDVSLLTGVPSIVTGIARTDCEVYEFSMDDLRDVLNGLPIISDIILQAFIARRQLLRESPDFTGLRVIGSRYSPDASRIRDFLARNSILFTWLDVENDPQMDGLLKQFGISEEDMPVAACGHRILLRNPSNRELAQSVGILHPLEQTVYDLAIVGAGPAGLAAAVYGASEGLKTVVLENQGPGGQAGSSMRIENYLGFPTGITGRELAYRATLQANKFGANLSVPSVVCGLSFENDYPIVHLEDGGKVAAKCLLIASGAEYRRLGVEGCEQFEGAGVYYAATPNEVQLCRGTTVLVVGAGNSAGQAAVYLSGHAKDVLLVVRGDDLYKSMSSYLVRRIEKTPNIEILLQTEIAKMCGKDHLNYVELIHRETQETRGVEASAVFSFIGATPRTDWVGDEVETDTKGFIKTGTALEVLPNWPLKRQPFLLETSRPGVFAAGDVRSGSSKRVATAVGEGSMAVQLVHEYLKEK